jgi:carboxymethylenebutenolidase
MTDIKVAARDGGAFESYLATPRSGKGPGVAIVSTIFGIEPDVKAYADRLAAGGCVASVPNVFWRVKDSGALRPDVPPSDPEFKRAVDRAFQLDVDASMLDLAAVIADLRARPECNGKVAVMGFCWGGRYALRAAAELPVEAALSFHGTQCATVLDRAPRAKCPMSFHWGDKDWVVPMPEIAKVQEAFSHAKSAEVRVHPGAEHSYMLPSRGAGYSESAAEASWSRAMEIIAPLRA